MKHLKLFFALFAMLALGVGNAWAETVTLSNANIAAMYNSSQTSYRSITVTDDNGHSYSAYAILNQHSKATSTYKFLQIKKYASNTAYYVQIPQMPGKITSISMTVSNSQKPITDGGNTATLYFSNSNKTSATGTGVASGTGDKSVTIDCSSLNLNEGYITAGGSVRIWDITITYETAGGGEPSTPTPSVTLDPSSKDFGTINVGETLSQEFTITTENTTATLTASIDNTTDYAVSGIVDNKFTVTYQPKSTGTHPATLTVKAGEEASATSALSGKGVTTLEGTWILVTDASSLNAGDEIIIAAKETDVALSTTQAGNNRPEVAITKNDNTITATSETQVLTLQAGNKENTLALYTGDGYLYAASSGSNWLRTETTLSDNSSWSIAVAADGTATLIAQGTNTRNTLYYNKTSKIFSCYSNAQQSIVIYKKVDASEVIAPTFNPNGGEYYGTQSVMITCATTDAKIYYTLDGNDPTDTSDEYTGGAITISETKTLKAIAIKGENKSEIAEATYTILAPLATMQEIFDKATAVGGTATPVEITFGNWVVSAVKEDGKTAFVTDGTRGFVIYDKDVNLGFSVGDILSGTAACKVQLYNGFAELTELKSNTVGLSVGSGGTITTQELDAAGIAALTGVNTGSLIKINGTCTSESSKYYVADVQIYTSLYDFGTLEVGAEYNITGIYQPYNTTKEMLPRSAADIEKVVGLPTATISIADITMEIGQEKTIEATITPDAAQSTVQYAITSGNEYITLSGTTIIAVAAGTATITATIAEKADEYKGATKEFTVTVKPQNIAELPFEFTGGKTDIENTLGISQEGLGSDYTTAGVTTKLKFDGTGDCVIIHFNGQAEKLAYDIKGNSFSKGTFTVQQSADGSAYTEVVAHTELGDAATKEHELAAESRYVKFIYTEKSSGNVGLGNIKITEPDNRADAELAWNPETVTLTVGDAFTAPTLSNPHTVSGITYESSNEAVATVSAEGVIALVNDAVGTATITAKFGGDDNYKAAEVSCTIKVKELPDNCDGTDDFETLEANTSYDLRKTTAEWIAENAAVAEIDDDTYIIINGKTSAVGTITSPVLNDGIGSIKIRYANTYSESNGVSFQLDIKQNDAVVKTYTITKANDAVVEDIVYTELIEDINVAGDFQMVFTNLSPTNSTSNKDRVSIGRLCWTNYTTPQEPAVENVTVTGATVFTMGPNITLSGSWNDKSVSVALWQGGDTQGFGTYAASDWGPVSIGTILAETGSSDGIYTDNGDGTFTFTGSIVDGETTYKITMTGANPASTPTETIKIEMNEVEFTDNGDGGIYIDVCEENYAWCVQFTVWDYVGAGTYDYIELMYSTEIDYYVYGSVTISYDEDAKTNKLVGEFTNEDGLAVHITFYEAASSGESNVLELAVSMDNLVVTEFAEYGVRGYAGSGISNDDYAYEVVADLYVDVQNPNDDGTYKLTDIAPSTLTISDKELTITDSYIDIAEENKLSAIITAEGEDMGVVKVTILMETSGEEVAPTKVVVNNATMNLDGDFLSVSGSWIDEDDTTYPVTTEIQGFAPSVASADYAISVTVGGMGDEDPWLGWAEGTVDVKVEDGLVTITGVLENTGLGITLDVAISGELPKYTRDVTSGNFGTICLPNNSASTSGAEFYSIVGKEDNTVYLGSVEKLEAGKPYFFYSTANQVTVIYEGEAVDEAKTDNGLVGTFRNDTEVAVGKYILKDNELHLCEGICYVNENRAYVDMDAIIGGKPTAQMPGRKYISMGVNGENEATGLDNITTTDAPVKVLVNGQLIIIREGVKYNVQGIRL